MSEFCEHIESQIGWSNLSSEKFRGTRCKVCDAEILQEFIVEHANGQVETNLLLMSLDNLTKGMKR